MSHISDVIKSRSNEKKNTAEKVSAELSLCKLLPIVNVSTSWLIIHLWLLEKVNSIHQKNDREFCLVGIDFN